MRTPKRLALAVASVALIGGGIGFAPAAQAAQANTVTPAKYAYGCDYTTATPQISYGSTGSAVKQAQCLLNYWLSSGLSVDGQFGPKTEAAVKYFQSEYCGLAVDGIVGPNTWYALENPGCP